MIFQFTFGTLTYELYGDVRALEFFQVDANTGTIRLSQTVLNEDTMQYLVSVESHLSIA